MGPLFWVGLSQTQVWRFLPLRLWTPRWCLPLTTATSQPRSLLWRTQWHRRVSLPARLRVSRASRKSLRRLPGLLFVTLSLRVCLWPPGRLLAGAPFLDSVMGCFIIFVMLSILSLNCNGIRNRFKRVGLVQWLRSLPVGGDVVCLQETHCLSSSECSSWFLSSGFSAVAYPGSSHSCGFIVLFRPSLSLVNSWCDVPGRYLQVEFSFFGSSFRVCCVYAPNRKPARDQFFGDLQSKIDPLIPTILPRCFPCGMVVDEEMGSKLCLLLARFRL